MHQLAGLLLILHLAASLGALLPDVRRFPRAATALGFGQVGLLVLLAAAVCFRGALELTGPVWLLFDSGRAIRLSAIVGAWGVWALALIAVGRCHDRTLDSSRSGGVLLGNAGLVLLVVADDWALFLGGWLLSVSQSRVATDRTGSVAEGNSAALADGLRTFSTVFVALGLGILAWNLPVSSWSDLSRWLTAHPELTRPQQALLFLGGFCGVLGSCLAAGLFPFHSLSIESGERSAGWSTATGRLGAMLPAWTLIGNLQPLVTVQPDVSALGQALAALTFFFGSIAAPAQKTRCRAQRTIAVAHAGIVVLGLLQGVPELRTAAALHGLILLIWMQTRDSRPSAAMISLTLLHLGIDGSGLILSRGTFPGAGLPGLAAWFALTFAAVRVGIDRTEADSSAATAPWTAFVPLLWGLPVALFGTTAAHSAFPGDAFAPLSALSVIRTWELVAASLLAFGAGLIWNRGLPSTRAWFDRFPTPVRLCESHFSLSAVWLVLLRLPLQFAGLLVASFEEGLPRRSGRSQVESESRDLAALQTWQEFAGWELSRGLLCVAALAFLLLRKGG